MPKNIILIDTAVKIVDLVLRETDFYIAALIVYSEKSKQKYENNPRISNVYTLLDLTALDTCNNIDYETLEKFKATQLKVENALHRRTPDYQIRKYTYFACLDFWLSFFGKHKVDAVVIEGLTHGFPHDTIPSDIALSLGIPAFNIENCGPYKRTLYDNNNDIFVSLSKQESVSIKDTIFYNGEGYGDDASQRLYGDCSKRPRKWIRRATFDVLLKLFGPLGIEFFKCLKKRSFEIKSFWGPRFDYSYLDLIIALWRIKKVKKHQKKACSAYDPELNYVYFALHLEPEANITTRTILDSQLVAIKMLSDSLPYGWVLYVKDHPQQHNVKSYSFYSKLYQGETYRSSKFYDILTSYANVKLVSQAVPSQKLLEKAQAVATMSGTVAWEGVYYKKPTFIFGKRTPLRLLNDIFYISSTESCMKAMKKLPFQPSYEDLNNVIECYLVDKSNMGYKTVLRGIAEQLNCRKS